MGDMTAATSGKNGSLSAEILEIKMEIDDDDEDVIQTTISISNEAPVPMGGLDVSVITNDGRKYNSIEGVTSLGLVLKEIGILNSLLILVNGHLHSQVQTQTLRWGLSHMISNIVQRKVGNYQTQWVPHYLLEHLVMI